MNRLILVAVMGLVLAGFTAGQMLRLLLCAGPQSVLASQTLELVVSVSGDVGNYRNAARVLRVRLRAPDRSGALNFKVGLAVLNNGNWIMDGAQST
ncbi:MAG: hypothetical protein KDB53_14210 [Planctomycetes bacterium]|nr:hypothetical protein [Planctomycetota bacterium]